MPALFCDLRPGAADLLAEYHALAAAGEGVALFWPAVTAHPALAPVADAAGLRVCLENEQLALLSDETLPAWLPLDDFHRVLLLSDTPALTPAEQQLADQILSRGCEAIEVLPPQAARSLAQSWHSGRRAGARLLQP